VETKQLTCIVCPVGCHLTVEIEDGDVKSVSGNTCTRGPFYAKNEIINPERILTSTVKLVGNRAAGMPALLPVRTDKPIPKSKLFDAMTEIRRITASAPISDGDILIHDFMVPGINLIASRDIK